MVRDGRGLGPAHVGDLGRGRRVSMNVVGHAGARVLDVVALDALGVRDRRPLEGVARNGVGSRRVGHELVDRDGLVVRAWGVGEVAGVEVGAVGLGHAGLEAPPGVRVASISLALGVDARLEVLDRDLEEVAGLGPLDEDRASEHVHAVACAQINQ